MEDKIINRVEQSSLISIDMEAWMEEEPYAVYDIKQHLFQELILREKDFRGFIKEFDWTIYSGKHLFIVCSTDAIIPTWAYMLIVSKVKGMVKSVQFCSEKDILEKYFSKIIQGLEVEKWLDKKVVIKGCSKVEVPVSAYVEITELLIGVAQSIMFGEPCSTVPIYKKLK
ncbi:MAG: DUF2480 family protein [Cytophagaceae bacterium]|jgi:hypothetical protein|nr:DUF2480 family protein [Cytophagaceae bacterium]